MSVQFRLEGGSGRCSREAEVDLPLNITLRKEQEDEEKKGRASATIRNKSMSKLPSESTRAAGAPRLGIRGAINRSLNLQHY
jgi:hypothetical protein